MKKLFICSIATVLTLSPSLFAAGDNVKTGWSFGAVPAVSYNSDLGFQYGVSGDVYYFGDGSTYPAYMHKFNMELSRFTKGSGRAHLFYDSKYLIPGVRVSAALTYVDNPLYSFYGFNGLAQEWSSSLDQKYYAFDRKMFRALVDFQGPICDGLNWAAGVAFWDYRIGSLDSKYEFEGATLYDEYVAGALIEADEASGGKRLELKAGLVYDTRDFEPAPSRGWWADLCLVASPDVFSDGYKYLKLAAHVRKYVTLVQDKLVFAGHLAYQGTIGGSAPFYMQQNISVLYLKQIMTEGLGSFNTVRGTLANRMIGDSYAWTNLELRYKILDFNFIKQDWYLGVNPFFDAGKICNGFRVDEMDYDLIASAGLGLKLVMNQNFIISAEYGKPFNAQLGPGSLNIGLNYIF